MESYTGQALNNQDIRIVDTLDPLGFKDINTADASTTVTIRNVTGLTIASIFSDNSGTVQANPYNTDSEGGFTFYAANGRYNVVINEGLPIEFTIFDVGLFDINDSIDMKNVNISKLSNPLFRGFVKNKLTDVINPGTSIAVVRGTTATSIDINGVLRTAATNTAREELSGSLFEGDGENFLSDPTNASLWNAIAGTFTTHAINAAIVGVDGNTGTVTEITSATGDARIRNGDSSSGVMGETYTGSLWIKANKVTSITTDINDLNSTVSPVTTEWKRIENTATTVNTKRFMDIVFTDSTAVYYVDRGQIEESPFATSQMDNVTRDADSQSFPVEGNFRMARGAISLTADVIGDTNNPQYLFAVTDGSTQNRIQLSRDNDKFRLIISKDNINEVAEFTITMDITTTYNIVVNYEDDNVEMFIDTVSVLLDTDCTMPNNLTIVDVGQNSSQGRNLAGHIQDLQFHQEPLSLDEIKYLSGS